MGRIVRNEEARELLELLRRIDEGYVPTEQEEKELKEVTFLKLSGLSLTSLPESIGNLTALQTLNVAGNQLTTLPESIGNLTALQRLYVSHNQLTALPASIGNLTALQRLYVSDNQLTALPASIGNLAALQRLYVSDNQLTALPESIGNLAALQDLRVSSNQLTALPESIGNLTALQILYVYNNQLTALPEFIGNLTALQSLNVAYNQLTALPESIGNLSALQSLNVAANPLKALPDGIWALPHLENLNVSSLRLHHLPPAVMRPGLDFIFDSDTLWDMNGIYLENTTLATQPISLFMQPRELIQAYFDTPKIPVNEGKVIFLGDGNVGKSYTIERILHGGEPGDYKTDMTPGISINRFAAVEGDRHFDIQFWDFGGQEVMHAMHRCFLTHRTCYVVMVTARQPDPDGRARYWLRNIESFAKGSDVLLVLNQWEDYANNTELNYNQLRTDFPNLIGFVTVSAKCASKEEFNALTQQIIDMASRLDSTSMDFPAPWHAIRQDLMAMAENGEPYINQDRYHQICAEHELEDADIRKWLLEWFNDLSTCFSYHQDAEKKELAEYKVLNPKWLTNAIYILILEGRKPAKKGILSRTDIEDLLKHPEKGTLPGVTYEPEECSYILEVMRKFTLTYAASDDEEFIPALCPNETPENLYPTRYKAHLRYEREYTYLPDSVVHQLMIYCYQSLRLDKCWRKGMCVRLPAFGLSAVVSMGGSDQLLTIDVYSDGSHELWELLQPILGALDRINERMNLKATDYVWPESAYNGRTFTERFPLKKVLNIKNGVNGRRPSNILQGDQANYAIDEVLYGIYGKDSVTAALVPSDHDRAEGLTPSRLAGNSFNNCSFHFYYGDVNITQNQGISEAILQALLDSRPSEEFLAEFARVLISQNNPQVKELGEAMENGKKEKKSRLEAFNKFLETPKNLLAVAKAAVDFWPTVKPLFDKAPDVFATVLNLISQLHH